MMLPVVAVQLTNYGCVDTEVDEKQTGYVLPTACFIMVLEQMP
jgi:hypothetical protein